MKIDIEATMDQWVIIPGWLEWRDVYVNVNVAPFNSSDLSKIPDMVVEASGGLLVGGDDFESGFFVTIAGTLDTAAQSATISIEHAGGWSPLPALEEFLRTPRFSGSASFNVDVNPPLTPRDNTTENSGAGYSVDPVSGQITVNGGGGSAVEYSWEERPVSNQTFAGITITMLLIAVIAAPLLWWMSSAASRGGLPCCKGGGGKRWSSNPVARGSGGGSARPLARPSAGAAGSA